jgi:hypothetical protein
VPRHTSASLEEAIVLVAGGDVVHLTVASLRPDNPHVVTVPVTGLPPIACAPVWPAAAQNPIIGEFARVTGTSGAPRADGRSEDG